MTARPRGCWSATVLVLLLIACSARPHRAAPTLPLGQPGGGRDEPVEQPLTGEQPTPTAPDGSCPPGARRSLRRATGWVDRLEGGWAVLLQGRNGYRQVPRCWLPSWVREGDYLIAGEALTGRTLAGRLTAVRRAVELRRRGAGPARAGASARWPPASTDPLLLDQGRPRDGPD